MKVTGVTYPERIAPAAAFVLYPLLKLFDLENLTVDDVMRPRGEIEAIDLNARADEILERLHTSHHAHLPAYQGELNEIVGIVHVRRALVHIGEAGFDGRA